MSISKDIASKHGMGAIALFLRECLRSIGLNLPIRLGVEFKSLQFHIKHLQEKGLDGSFDCSSIDDSVLRKCVNHPTAIHQISSGIDTRPITLPSRKCSLKDVLSNRTSNSSDHNNYSPSLALTRE